MEHLVQPIMLRAVAWTCLMSASSAIFAESPVGEPPRYCTVFNHFTKSGGSSLKKLLVQSCKGGRTRRPGLITGVLRTTPATRLNTLHNASVIVGPGEIIRGPLRAIGRDCEFFTMLRDPVERLVSAFYDCPTDSDTQDRPSKWCRGSEGEEALLEDRLLEFATEEWSNSGLLSTTNSTLCDPDFGPCGPEHARETQFKPRDINTTGEAWLVHNETDFNTTRKGWLVHDDTKGILSTYTAVGIFEEWELSMRLFNAKVKSPVRKWNANVAANPGKQSTSRERLLEWARADEGVHSLLAADILLYEHAVDVFRQQTAAALHVEWGP